MFSSNHLFIWCLSLLFAIVLLASIPAVGAQGDVGGKLGVIDGLMALLITSVGALIQSVGGSKG